MARPPKILRGQMTMPREDVEFLDTLGLDCKTAGGNSMARTEIMRSLIVASKKLKLKAEDLRTGEGILAAVADKRASHQDRKG